MPRFDVEAASSRALTELDTDGNSEISATEAKRSPAMTDAFARFDKDASGSVSKAELSDRFQRYQSAGVALYHWNCQITSNGRPLVGATVTLVPEAFLGENFPRASATTDSRGTAAPVINDSDLNGAQFGLYRVEISRKDASGKETIPEQYNVKTSLGQELASGVRSAESVRNIQISDN